jgi:hypothetical protein
VCPCNLPIEYNIPSTRLPANVASRAGDPLITPRAIDSMAQPTTMVTPAHMHQQQGSKAWREHVMQPLWRKHHIHSMAQLTTIVTPAHMHQQQASKSMDRTLGHCGAVRA